MSDQPTEPHYPVWGEEEPTEVIPGLPSPPPIIMPPPPIVRNTPIEAVTPAKSAFDRARAGFAALSFACLIIGVMLGFLISSFTTAMEIRNTPPEIQIATQKTTATTTATSVQTKVKTKTERPAPTTVTETARATATFTKPGRTKTVTRTRTPQSCLNAIDAANQYENLSQHRRGRSTNFLLREARQNLRYWSSRCKSGND